MIDDTFELKTAMAEEKSNLLQLPDGLTKFWGGSPEEGEGGVFTHALCKDAKGNCYLHISSKPNISDALASASGKTIEEITRDFNKVFEARVNPLVAARVAFCITPICRRGNSLIGLKTLILKM